MRVLISLNSGDEMHYSDLKEFFHKKIHSEYVKEKTFTVYARKGEVLIATGSVRKTFNTLSLASISADGRETNVKTKLNPVSTGNFKTFMEQAEDLAKNNGFECVYVESVLNDFLPGVLERRGYQKCNAHLGTLNFVKFLNP